MRKTIKIQDLPKLTEEDIDRIFPYFKNYGKLKPLLKNIECSGGVYIKHKEIKMYRGYACCYIFMDYNYKVLYVGKTKDFYQRFLSHLYRNDKINGAQMFAIIKTRNIGLTEKILINYFKPETNLLHFLNLKEGCYLGKRVNC